MATAILYWQGSDKYALSENGAIKGTLDKWFKALRPLGYDRVKIKGDGDTKIYEIRPFNQPDYLTETEVR